jgi:hypothetical protein
MGKKELLINAIEGAPESFLGSFFVMCWKNPSFYDKLLKVEGLL